MLTCSFGCRCAWSPRGAAEDLERSVGDDLVGVHVGRGAGAALDQVDDELVVQRAAADLLAGRDDRRGARVVEQAEVAVRERRRLLDRGQRVDQVGRGGDRLAADREVLDGAQRMDAPVDRRRGPRGRRAGRARCGCRKARLRGPSAKSPGFDRSRPWQTRDRHGWPGLPRGRGRPIGCPADDRVAARAGHDPWPGLRPFPPQRKCDDRQVMPGRPAQALTRRAVARPPELLNLCPQGGLMHDHHDTGSELDAMTARVMALETILTEKGAGRPGGARRDRRALRDADRAAQRRAGGGAGLERSRVRRLAAAGRHRRHRLARLWRAAGRAHAGGLQHARRAQPRRLHALLLLPAGRCSACRRSGTSPRPTARARSSTRAGCWPNSALTLDRRTRRSGSGIRPPSCATWWCRCGRRAPRGMDEAALAGLVTRDSMIGTGLARSRHERAAGSRRADGLRPGRAGARRAGVPRRLGAAGARRCTIAAGAMGHWTIDETPPRAREPASGGLLRLELLRDLDQGAGAAAACATASSPRPSWPPAMRSAPGTAPKRVLQAADVAGCIARGGPVRARARGVTPAFAPGDRVRTRVMHPPGHTRLPRYARGKTGTVESVHGCARLPRLERAREGRGAAVALHRGLRRAPSSGGATPTRRQRLSIDAWESYLERA